MSDMRLKIQEYIKELDQEINRCISLVEVGDYGLESNPMEARIMALTEVKENLQSRLEEDI